MGNGVQTHQLRHRVGGMPQRRIQGPVRPGSDQGGQPAGVLAHDSPDATALSRQVPGADCLAAPPDVAVPRHLPAGAYEAPLAEAFPEEFDKSLKKFLFKKMREAAPLCKEHIADSFTGTSRLEDFDWRLDFKVSSKAQARVRQP